MQIPIRINYKNKSILYVDYTSAGSKEEILELLKNTSAEYIKQPLKSVLAIINLSNVKYDIEVVTFFKKSKAKTAPYEKKEAIVGMSSLQKVGYDFISGLTNDKMKAFDSEIEAKEWLVKD